MRSGEAKPETIDLVMGERSPFPEIHSVLTFHDESIRSGIIPERGGHIFDLGDFG
jgi:hypothetical protein